MAGEGASQVLANQGTEIAEIFANSLNLNELGFNKYPVLPLNDLPVARVREIYEKMVDDIFSVVSMTREDFPQCWDRCVTQLESGKVLLATIFTEFEGYQTIKDACVEAIGLPRMDEQAPCLPAPIMVSLIASINYCKIANARPHSSIINMLDEHGTMAWLKVAIQVFGTTGQDPFLVTRDNSVNSPTTERSDGIWAVKATMPPPHRYLALVHRELPRLRAAPEFASHLARQGESLEEALQRVKRRLSRDIGDADTGASAEVCTVTRTINRDQAFARVGEVIDQMRDPSVDRKAFKPEMELLMEHSPESQERIQKFEAVLAQDITETSWELQLPGQRIEMQDSDLAGPSMKLLGALVNSLPKKDSKKLARARFIQAWKDVKTFIDYQQRFRDDWTKFAEMPLQNRSPNTSPISDGTLEKLNGTLEKLKETQEQLTVIQEQLKETLVQAVRDKLESQKTAPQEVVDDFKALYILFRRDGLVIPCELHNLAAYSLNADQHNDVLAALPDEEMLDADA
ncbi:hypothetical protein H9Q69_011453 [Fusarium xylarioides]|nr:hypothetical protein H9Q69_011453 [Fusarium xylarioides]